MPFTAPRLRERRSNTLRDFVDVAGPLGITHMMALSQTTTNTLLRLCRIPHGPTLTFRLETYSLARQVRAAQRNPVDIATAFEHPPLVVLHGFNTAGSSEKAAGTAGVSLADALKMTTTMLQNTFPQIQPATVKVSSCKRVVLFHYDAASGLIEFRHFYVRTVSVGMSRAVQKVAGSQSSAKHLPDLGKLGDVSEFVLSGGRTGTASDSEGEPDEASRVVMPAVGAAAAAAAAGAGSGSGGRSGGQQSSIRLSEIGPRLTLRLVKIEQELARGEVLYHAFESRTVAQAAELRKGAAERERQKEARKAVQAENVARKEAERAAKKAAKDERRAARQEAAKQAAAEGRLADDEGAVAEASDDEEEGEEEEDDDVEEEEGGDAEALDDEEEDDDAGSFHDDGEEDDAEAGEGAAAGAGAAAGDSEEEEDDAEEAEDSADEEEEEEEEEEDSEEEAEAEAGAGSSGARAVRAGAPAPQGRGRPQSAAGDRPARGGASRGGRGRGAARATSAHSAGSGHDRRSSSPGVGDKRRMPGGGRGGGGSRGASRGRGGGAGRGRGASHAKKPRR